DPDAEGLSRAITGWVLEAPAGYQPPKPIDPRGFRSNRRTGMVPVFHPDLFDDKLKTILGETKAFDARDAMRHLAMQPATGQRFRRLLVRHFGVADPSQRVEKQLTETYQSTGGSMEAMLRTLVASDEFWKADSRWSLIKSPTHLAVGACRQLEI